MIEFALVLPMLFMIILITLAAALSWAVRIEQHKVAYDIARHVAKQEPQKDGKNDFDHDLVTGCYPNTANPDLTERNHGDADDIIAYHFGDNPNLGLANSMSTPPKLKRITTGPPIKDQKTPGGDNIDPNYFCNMSISATITYELRVPAWEAISAIYGAGPLHEIEETGIAARLQSQYEEPKDKPSPTPT
ncbi:MAG: hypothetical protein QOE92_1574 [Chloroflexota bacterium]|jgi:hypothetical protein|nr:hypothetical protein [Chloroflexota bacterium]